MIMTAEEHRRIPCWMVLLLLGLCLAAPAAQGQDTDVVADRTEQLATSTGPARVEILIDLANQLAPKSSAQSREYGREALDLARAAGDSSQAGKALLSLSQAHFLAGEYDRSLDNSLQALRVAEGLDDPPFHAHVLNALGAIHQKLDMFDEAHDLYGQSLAIARLTGNRRGEARNLNSLGVNAWYQENYGQALTYYRESLQVQREIGDPLGTAAALNNVAMVHHVREEYDEAIDHYEQSLQIKREHGYTSGVAATLGNLGELYLSLGRYPDALTSLEQSRDLAADLNAVDILVNSHYSLADYHAAVGDHAAALRNYKSASEREKEIFSARNTATIAEMQAKYETEKQNLEIDRLNILTAQAERDLAEQRRARFWLMVYLLFAVLTALVMAWLFRRQFRAHRRVRAQAEELEQAASKIAALTDLLPICANCKMIRDQEGDWHQLEGYLMKHADLTFTHGICPQCATATLAKMDKA